MERIEIFHDVQDGQGGFHSLQEAINHWLRESKEVEIVDRQTNLIKESTRILMVVTIFYREPIKASE